ncbi:MAG: hypothetical protein ACKVRN_14670 [Pyrinomonadaceae bacterium]
MNIIKLILATLGLVFIGIILLSLLGWAGTLLWWAFWLGLIGLIGYGGYRLFLKMERKALGADTHDGLGTGDIKMSWDEYDKKYLHK